MKKLTNIGEDKKEKLRLLLKNVLYNTVSTISDEEYVSAISYLYGIDVEIKPTLKELIQYILIKYEVIAKKDYNDKGCEEVIKVIKQFPSKLDCLYKSLKEKKVQKIIVFEAPPLKIDKNFNYVGKYIFDSKPISNIYYSSIQEAFEINEEESLIDVLSKKEIGFFDIIPLPLPFDSDIRKKWSTEEVFKIGDKPITVHLFEWALEKFIDKSGCTITSETKFAIGMPTNTSVSIFDYYSIHNNNFQRIHLDSLKETNNNLTKSQYSNLDGITLPLFKSNIVGSNNYPNAKLIKLAFDEN